MPFNRYTWRGRVIELAGLERRLGKLGIRGNSSSNLSRVLSGRHEPGFELMQGLAHVLGVSLEEVVQFIKHCRNMNASFKAVQDSFDDGAE